MIISMGGRLLELDRGYVARVEGSPALTPTDDRGREQTRLSGWFADPAYWPSFTRLRTLLFPLRGEQWMGGTVER
jgi:hypothetical protein